MLSVRRFGWIRGNFPVFFFILIGWIAAPASARDGNGPAAGLPTISGNSGAGIGQALGGCPICRLVKQAGAIAPGPSKVDGEDLGVVLGCQGVVQLTASCQAVDLNVDGKVDSADVSLVILAWKSQESCASNLDSSVLPPIPGNPYSKCDPCELIDLSDLNDDGVVNGADLGILLGCWGIPQCEIGGPSQSQCSRADLNRDGHVNLQDRLLLFQVWEQKTCSSCSP